MIRPGLVSVTFRELSPQEITTLAGEARCEGIEWGGDVHVPHGDLRKAGDVREITKEAGLATTAYGSYYRIGKSEDQGLRFETVLETALEMEAPTVRVWAGTHGSQESTPEYRERVIQESRRIADLALEAGLSISYEYHRGSLTDTGDSARTLLEEVRHPNVFTFWQQRVGVQMDRCLADISAILPWLKNLHVFHWWPDQEHRRPLAEGEEKWMRYLRRVAADGRERFASIEFVKDDDPENFLKDAGTLRSLLASI